MHANTRGRVLEQEEVDCLSSSSSSLSLPLSTESECPSQGKKGPPAVIPEDVEISIIDQNLGSPFTSSSDTKTYIVTFADDDTSIDPAAQCPAIAESVGGTVDFVYTDALRGCALTVPLPPQEDLAIQMAQEVFITLSESPGVVTVEENKIIQVEPMVPADADDDDTELLLGAEGSCAASSAPSWGLDRINQCNLSCDNKATKKDAKGVTVFIVDSGILGTHSEFRGQLNLNDNCHFSAFRGVSALTDGHGHG